MTAENTCSKCHYIECFKDGFPGRVIVLRGKPNCQKSLIPIEKCNIRTGEYPEEPFVRASGWGIYLAEPNPELTLEEDDQRRRRKQITLPEAPVK